MIQRLLAVIENRHISGANYKLTLAGPEIAAAARPGQFVMVRLVGGLTPFLPRPFSIHRINNENGVLEILYKVIGQGTRQMSRLSAGDRLDVVGPLGKGFRTEQRPESISLVAGGIGVAPLVFLADHLAAAAFPPDRVDVLIGGAGQEDVLCRRDFADLGMNVLTATDDGSQGYHGLVTRLFEKRIGDKAPDMAFACGPPAMLREMAGISAARKIPCQVSIETIMACGMGACLGCAVKSHDDPGSYKHACRDGPVFFSTEIDLAD